ELKSKGYEIVDNSETADVIILNTCTVKGATENKIMNQIRKINKNEKPLVVAGCLTVNEQRIRKMAPGASIVGTGALKSIADATESALNFESIIFNEFDRKDELSRVFTAPILRVPISDGCISTCYFCQTKLARPGLRSYTPKTVVRWIQEGISKGAKEVQMTSMDSGAYGLDLRTNLIELMKYVGEINEDFLVRLGMINPQHVKRMQKQLIETLKNKRYYKFLHIPVQSGSEKVCREMNRGHSVKDFIKMVSEFRKEIPEICIATDIIVGYPTENEEDFEDTIELIKKCEIDIVNVSKFSPRPGTKAKEMKQIRTQEVKRRSTALAKLVRMISGRINKKLIGNRYEVLITEKQRDFTGRNINYKQVVLKDEKLKLGKIVNVEIVDANYGCLFGRLIR
ncbi:tRNA (N(6)-L-threonylcarbamoyladenosine(37)-C(2))-methylthiotransferase, partial [Candidatus Micrarchaeota archaeon]|nr:tRNA (N(6)-L-threonylcarbamoyladenosine(37)-C(2))-methylthiotransferase [Candidatus Micrarchaeota archaeon]